MLIVAIRISVTCMNSMLQVYLCEVYATSVRHFAFGIFGMLTKFVLIFLTSYLELCR